MSLYNGFVMYRLGFYICRNFYSKCTDDFS